MHLFIFNFETKGIQVLKHKVDDRSINLSTIKNKTQFHHIS